jgi:hypothetical protein
MDFGYINSSSLPIHGELNTDPQYRAYSILGRAISNQINNTYHEPENSCRKVTTYTVILPSSPVAGLVFNVCLAFLPHVLFPITS